MARLLWLVALLATPGSAQLFNPPASSAAVDLSGYATTSQVNAATAPLATKAQLTAATTGVVKSVNAASPDGSGNVALTIPSISGLATTSQLATATAGVVKSVNAANPDGSGNVSLTIPSISGLATTSALSVVAATIPVAAGSLPPMETSTTGAVGTAGTYRPATALAPRITRAAIVTTIAGGTGSVTWADALPSAPVVMLTPVSASSSIDCQLTSAPTTTTVAFRCFTAQTTVLNLGIITAGLTLNPVTNSAAGLQVHVLAIPTTQ